MCALNSHATKDLNSLANQRSKQPSKPKITLQLRNCFSSSMHVILLNAWNGKIHALDVDVAEEAENFSIWHFLP